MKTFEIHYSGKMEFECETKEEAKQQFKEVCQIDKSDSLEIDWVSDITEDADDKYTLRTDEIMFRPNNYL